MWRRSGLQTHTKTKRGNHMKVSLSFSSSNALEAAIINHIEAIKAQELKRGRKTSNATAVTMMLSASIHGNEEAKGALPSSQAKQAPLKNGVKK
jgi:hypothetical protein